MTTQKSKISSATDVQLTTSAALTPTPTLPSEVISPTIGVYVDRYCRSLGKTVEGLFEMAITVADAKRDLKKIHFREFCSHVRLDPKSSKCRIFIKIARDARLHEDEVKKRLPPN